MNKTLSYVFFGVCFIAALIAVKIGPDEPLEKHRLIDEKDIGRIWTYGYEQGKAVNSQPYDTLLWGNPPTGFTRVKDSINFVTWFENNIK